MSRVRRLPSRMGLRVLWATVFLAAAGAPARGEVVGALLDLGRNFYELTGEVATPHIPWARPLPGGPIRTLFLVPRDGAREAVELSQRVHLAYESVLFYRPNVFGHPRSRSTIVGAHEEDKTADLRQKLGHPWELMVIGRVEWETVPDWARRQIVARVEEGASLLYCFPDSAAREAWSAGDPLPLVDAVSAAPYGAIPPFRGAEDPVAGLLGSLHCVQHGKGRVGLVTWPGIRPGVRSVLTPTLSMPVYEYHQALLARMVLFLGGRECVSGIEWAPGAPGVVEGTIRLAAPLPSAEYTVRISDAEGREEYLASGALSGAETTVWLADAPLCAGVHYLDVLLRRNGKALGWACRHLEIESANPIREIALDAPFFEAGTPVTGTVRLAAPLPEDESLRLSVQDNEGRITAQQCFDPGGPEADTAFRLPLGASLTRVNYLVAERMNGDHVLDRAVREFSVPRRDPPDDFLFIGWGGASDVDYLSRLAGERLRDTGLDGYSGGGFSREGVRGPALFNQSKIPYAWRVAAHYDKHVEDGVRTPCLTDPAYREQERKRFLEQAGECDAFGPLAYHLGDESYYMLFDPFHGLGSCYSPTCREAFREFLTREYGSIEELNRVWGSAYAAWEDVVLRGPADFPAANEAPRMDHLRFLAHKFTDIHRLAVDAIHEVDPQARVGLEGLEALDASMGIDWYPLMKLFRLLGVYPYNQWTTKDLNRHCVRSFAEPGTLLGMWYGGYIGHRDEALERWFPWYALFLGFNSVWWYDTGKPGEMYNALAPDLSMTDSFRQTTEEIAEIKDGIGKWVIDAERAGDKVAIHYSYRSFIVDHLDLPRLYERRPGMYKAATAAFIQLCEDLGLSFDMVATEEIEEGALRDRGYRALIMPCVQSMTERETREIIAFVREGGLAVADWLTGIRDAHGVPRDRFPIDEIFGIERDPRMDVFRGAIELRGSAHGIDADLVLPDRELELFSTVTTARPLGTQVRSFKAGMVNACGDGKAVYLGFPIEGYVADRYRGHEGPMREFFRRVFAAGGVEAPLRVVSAGGATPGMKIARFRRGVNETVLAFRDPLLADTGPVRGTLVFPRRAHLYDVRRGMYLGHTDRVNHQWLSGKMEVFALLPYRAAGTTITSPSSPVRRGAAASLRVNVFADAGEIGDHVLHVEVFGPEGDPRRALERNIEARDGSAAFHIPIALNDPAGRWSITARDTLSGLRTVGAFEVE